MNHRPFGSTLLVGAGPAALHLAVDLARASATELGLVNRRGPHAEQIQAELTTTDYRLRTIVEVDPYRHLSGEARLTQFYAGFETVEDRWDTLVLCTPSDCYLEVIDALQLERLTRVQRIILLSPGLGSTLLVQSQLGAAGARIEVLSCSTYYAATRLDPTGTSVLTAYVKGFKRNLYLASNVATSSFLPHLQAFFLSLGLRCQCSSHPLEAESRSITTYVHPPFFINDFSLQEIFSEQPSKKSMYKLYPEGPITQTTIRTMRLLWTEISTFVRQFGAEPVNLLKFLNDDNYPVLEETLSRADIETFPDVEPTRQEYLLYVRYSSILIDPFSTPDEHGRYFDFSAFPYKQVHQNEHGQWVIPRVPYEDYKRLKLLHGLAARMQVPMPVTARLIERFEAQLQAFVAAKGREQIQADFLRDTTPEEVDIIARAWVTTA